MVRIPESTCEVCRSSLNEDSDSYPADKLTPYEWTPPRPGDISICPVCKSVGIYGDNLVVKPPTKEEVDRLGKAISKEITDSFFSMKAYRYTVRFRCDNTKNFEESE